MYRGINLGITILVNNIFVREFIIFYLSSMRKLYFFLTRGSYTKLLLFGGFVFGLSFFSFNISYGFLATPPTIQGVLGCPTQPTDCKVNQILPGGKLQVRVSGVSMQALENENAAITLNGLSYTTDFDASIGSLTAEIPADINPGNYTLTLQGGFNTVTWPTALPTGAQVTDPDNPVTPTTGAQCGGGVLGGLGCIKPQFDPKGSVAGAQNIGDFIIAVINVLFGLLLSISVLFIIIGGYQYVTSAGKEDQAKSGRRTVTYAVIGVAVAILSYMIVRVVEGTLSK